MQLLKQIQMQLGGWTDNKCTCSASDSYSIHCTDDGIFIQIQIWWIPLFIHKSKTADFNTGLHFTADSNAFSFWSDSVFNLYGLSNCLFSARSVRWLDQLTSIVQQIIFISEWIWSVNPNLMEVDFCWIRHIPDEWHSTGTDGHTDIRQG